MTYITTFHHNNNNNNNKMFFDGQFNHLAMSLPPIVPALAYDQHNINTQACVARECP